MQKKRKASGGLCRMAQPSDFFLFRFYGKRTPNLEKSRRKHKKGNRRRHKRTRKDPKRKQEIFKRRNHNRTKRQRRKLGRLIVRRLLPRTSEKGRSTSPPSFPTLDNHCRKWLGDAWDHQLRSTC